MKLYAVLLMMNVCCFSYTAAKKTQSCSTESRTCRSFMLSCDVGQTIDITGGYHVAKSGSFACPQTVSQSCDTFVMSNCCTEKRGDLSTGNFSMEELQRIKTQCDSLQSCSNISPPRRRDTVLSVLEFTCVPVPTNPTVTTDAIVTSQAISTRAIPTSSAISTGAIPTSSAISTGAIPTSSAISTGTIPTGSAISTGAIPTSSAISTGAIPTGLAISTGSVPTGQETSTVTVPNTQSSSEDEDPTNPVLIPVVVIAVVVITVFIITLTYCIIRGKIGIFKRKTTDRYSMAFSNEGTYGSDNIDATRGHRPQHSDGDNSTLVLNKSNQLNGARPASDSHYDKPVFADETSMDQLEVVHQDGKRQESKGEIHLYEPMPDILYVTPIPSPPPSIKSQEDGPQDKRGAESNNATSDTHYEDIDAPSAAIIKSEAGGQDRNTKESKTHNIPNESVPDTHYDTPRAASATLMGQQQDGTKEESNTYNNLNENAPITHYDKPATPTGTHEGGDQTASRKKSNIYNNLNNTNYDIPTSATLMGSSENKHQAEMEEESNGYSHLGNSSQPQTKTVNDNYQVPRSALEGQKKATSVYDPVPDPHHRSLSQVECTENQFGVVVCNFNTTKNEDKF